MKKSIAILITIFCFYSCNGNRKLPQADISDNNVCIENHVTIIYSSPEAVCVPAYDSTKIYDHPLSLIETTNTTITPVNIDNVHAYNSNGKKVYEILLLNMTEDTICIESLKLPDNNFKATWFGPNKYIPKLFTGFRLMCNEDKSIKDYRFIISYKEKNYLQQEFHINLHPDAR